MTPADAGNAGDAGSSTKFFQAGNARLQTLQQKKLTGISLENAA